MTIRVDALQEDGVHVDEVGHQDAASLRGGELLPGRARAARCRADPGIVQDSLDRGGGDRAPGLGELAVHASVSPHRVVCRGADHQFADSGCWPCGATTLVSDDVRDESCSEACPGQAGRDGDGQDPGEGRCGEQHCDDHGHVEDDELCVPRTSSTSCDQAIFVDQATGASVFSDAVLLQIDRFGQRCQRRGAVQRAVRPMLVMVGLVVAQDPPQMVWFDPAPRRTGPAWS